MSKSLYPSVYRYRTCSKTFKLFEDIFCNFCYDVCLILFKFLFSHKFCLRLLHRARTPHCLFSNISHKSSFKCNWYRDPPLTILPPPSPPAAFCNLGLKCRLQAVLVWAPVPVTMESPLYKEEWKKTGSNLTPTTPPPSPRQQ